MSPEKTKRLAHLYSHRHARHSYDVFVGLATRSHPSTITTGLHSCFPEDFRSAHATLEYADLLILAASVRCSIFRLTDPDFDAVSEIRDQLLGDEAFDRLTHHPLSRHLDVASALDETEMRTRHLTSNAGKATWAIVSGMQDPFLSSSDVISSPWLLRT